MQLMVSRGADGSDKDIAAVVKYLTTNYGPKPAPTTPAAPAPVKPAIPTPAAPPTGKLDLPKNAQPALTASAAASQQNDAAVRRYLQPMMR